MKKTAAALLVLLTVAGPAQALTISAQVGPLLIEAKAMIEAKNYEGAMTKVNEAEAVKSYPDDETVIDQFRKLIASLSQP